MLILGLDLGQSKSAWAQMDTATNEYKEGWVTMEDAALLRLLERCHPQQLVIESGPLAARVHDLARAHGIAVLVADTTAEAWCWRNVKRKTDRDDALKLVRLAALGQINPVHMPAPAVRQLRALLEYRRAMTAEQTRCKNRIRATLLTVGRRLPAGRTGLRRRLAVASWSAAARTTLRAELRPLAECAVEELWRGLAHTELQHLMDVEARLAEVSEKLAALAKHDPAVARLDAMPGVGPLTAQVLVAVLDQPRRFRTRRQVAAYGGLVPRRFQSGQMDRSGRISKRGSPLLRWALNQAAWAAVRGSSEVRAFYLRMGGSSKKRRKQAIVAVMRKLLVIGWALLRDGTRYQADRLRGRRQPAQAA